MSIKIVPSQYKDLEAITIESSVLRAQFLPDTGSKLASLVVKPLNLELMVQRPASTYLRQPFDGNYVAGECSGFDDMFPTIDTCAYERYPWKGTLLPDHGEVWSLPWILKQEDERLHFSVNGVRLPYRLEKWVSFSDESVLRLDYRLTNPTPFEMDFIWAAHIMLNLFEGCELVLPQGVKKIVNCFNTNGSLGSYGDEFDYPAFTDALGAARDLRWLRPPSARDAEKYYIKGKLNNGQCLLKYPKQGFTLGVSFPVETVPYLGILSNEMGWQDLYNIFIEPCTGTFDRIDVARLRRENSVVLPNSSYEWHLSFSLDLDPQS